MPAQGLYERPRNFPLSIIIRDRFAEKTAAIRCPQRLERIGVEAPAADPGKDRVKQAFRKPARFRREEGRSGLL